MDTIEPVKDTFMPMWKRVLYSEKGEVPVADPPAAAPAADPSLHNPAPLAPGNGDPALADPPPADPPAADPPAANPPADPVAKGWFDKLPEDLRNNPNVQKYKSEEEMVKGHLELVQMLGNDKIALPKDENDQVAIDHLNKALGVPEEASKYELPAVEPLEGMEHMQFGKDAFQEMAFKHKLTPKQAAGIQSDYVEMLAQIKNDAESQFVASINDAKTQLTKEWGLKYDSNVKLAQDVMNKFSGGKENFDYINAKIGTDPIALKFLAEVGAQFAEGTLGAPGQGGTNTNFTKTPGEAKIEYETIMSDTEDIYWAGVRNKKIVSETARKERISYVESLLTMQQPARPA